MYRMHIANTTLLKVTGEDYRRAYANPDARAVIDDIIFNLCKYGDYTFSPNGADVTLHRSGRQYAAQLILNKLNEGLESDR